MHDAALYIATERILKSCAKLLAAWLLAAAVDKMLIQDVQQKDEEWA